MLSNAVFIDKDGTLVDNVPYNVDPRRVRLATGAGPALARLKRAGYKLIVITNQPGIELGLFDTEALVRVRSRIDGLLRRFGAKLTDFYFCPHVPSEIRLAKLAPCVCRKPQPGLLLQAAQRHRIDLARSWMIGDILDDIEAGRRAGCQTMLIDAGNETEWKISPERQPHRVARTWKDAAEKVLAARTRPPARCA